jgi:hypothetical protein
MVAGSQTVFYLPAPLRRKVTLFVIQFRDVRYGIWDMR